MKDWRKADDVLPAALQRTAGGEISMTLNGEELAKLLLAVTGGRDKNVYVDCGKIRRVVGIYVQELEPRSIVIDTEEL